MVRMQVLLLLDGLRGEQEVILQQVGVLGVAADLTKHTQHLPAQMMAAVGALHRRDVVNVAILERATLQSPKGQLQCLGRRHVVSSSPVRDVVELVDDPEPHTVSVVSTIAHANLARQQGLPGYGCMVQGLSAVMPDPLDLHSQAHLVLFELLAHKDIHADGRWSHLQNAVMVRGRRKHPGRRRSPGCRRRWLPRRQGVTG